MPLGAVWALCVSAALLACGSSSDGGSTSSEPEVFTGSVDEFYVVPDPLPEGEPGDLIRIQAIGESLDATTLRIMYHSRDAQDRDRAVTGILTYPNAAPPEGVWPVVAWAHGTTGLASPCAPSRGGSPAPRFGITGVGVATDYIGLGPVGEIHPYLSRLSEGHSVIDSVRAARDLPAAGAGGRWLAVGHSQGGHAAQSTHELAEIYAPELEHLGTASIAPGALFDRSYGIDDVIVHVVGAMGLYGGVTDYPEIRFEDYASPDGVAAAEVMETGCLNEIGASVLSVPIDEFYDHHPLETEPARSLFLANDVGGVRAFAPLLLVSGTADTTVVIERMHDLLDKLCSVGQVTEYLELEGADHRNEVPLAADEIEAWFEARLRGDAAIDACAAP